MVEVVVVDKLEVSETGADRKELKEVEAVVVDVFVVKFIAP